MNKKHKCPRCGADVTKKIEPIINGIVFDKDIVKLKKIFFDLLCYCEPDTTKKSEWVTELRQLEKLIQKYDDGFSIRTHHITSGNFGINDDGDLVEYE